MGICQGHNPAVVNSHAYRQTSPSCWPFSERYNWCVEDSQLEQNSPTDIFGFLGGEITCRKCGTCLMVAGAAACARSPEWGGMGVTVLAVLCVEVITIIADILQGVFKGNNVAWTSPNSGSLIL